jgi:periplasmic protein CpxP/Spy
MKIASFVAGTLAALVLFAPPAAPAETAPGASAPVKAAVSKRIELRIKKLHDELKITVDEDPQWAAVADAIRDDARTVGLLIHERRAKAATMNAVEDLRSYQEITEAHAKGMAKLVTAFEALYDVMPPEQKKIADAVFAKAMHTHPAHAKAK